MTTTDTTTTTERWTYLGRRYWPGQGLISQWEKADGSEAAFKKFPAGVVGGIFEVNAVSGGKQVTGSPKFTGDRVDADRVTLLQALDRNAYETKATVDAEKRLSKSTELDDALAPLERLAAKSRSSAELEALLGVIRSRLTKAKWNS